MNVEDRLAAFESQMVEVLAQFATLRGMQDTLDKECERLRAENRTLRNRAVELDSEKDRLKQRVEELELSGDEVVTWQRFVNVVDPPRWEDIDPAEKDEWERLGYPLRALYTHPAPIAAVGDEVVAWRWRGASNKWWLTLNEPDFSDDDSIDDSAEIEPLVRASSLAALQQRVEELELLLASKTVAYRDELIAAAEARIVQLETVLKWARTCVPFPSDCHDAIQAALKE